MLGPELILCVVHNLISDVVEALNQNQGKWLRRELSVETWESRSLDPVTKHPLMGY